MRVERGDEAETIKVLICWGEGRGEERYLKDVSYAEYGAWVTGFQFENLTVELLFCGGKRARPRVSPDSVRMEVGQLYCGIYMLVLPK